MGIYERIFGSDDTFQGGTEEDWQREAEQVASKQDQDLGSYGELILDNIVGLDNDYDSFGEKLGRTINEDEIGFLKETGKGIYEGAKDFVQAPVETTKEAVGEVISSTKDLFTKDLDDRLMEMYGVDITTATGDQINAAREGVLGDALGASSLIPAAGLAVAGTKTLASVLPDVEFDPNTLGMNMGNIKFNQKTIADSDLNEETLDTLNEELMSVEAYKAAGMGANGGPPNTTVKGYKLFRINRETGELFPLYVDANNPIPVGDWVPAISGDVAKSGKVKSSIGELAYRPGFHAAQLPWVNHIGSKFPITKQQYDELSADGANNLIIEKKNIPISEAEYNELKAQGVSVSRKTNKKGEVRYTKAGEPEYFERLRDEDTVWAEIEMPNDVDWQSEATARAVKLRDGSIDNKTAHITDQIPEGGFYYYNTKAGNPNQWLIGGSMKINRILDDAEVDAINQEAGVLGSDMPRTPYSQTQKVPATVASQTEEMLDLDRRVDTRLPTSKTSPDFERMGQGQLVSDGDAMFSANTNMSENFAMMAEYYPGMKNLWSDDVAETRANITQQMTDNIVSLYDMSARLGIAEESKQWYRGANRIALGLSSRFGVPDTKTAGVLAALSPQKNWFENVALAERLIKHHTELGPNAPWSQAMDDITTTVPPARRKQGTTSFQDPPKNAKILESIKGKTWGQLETPEQKGMWLRAYDEAHFGRQFREVSPEGDILGYYKKNDGTPALASHQGFSTLAKVVRILEGDGSLESISPELGKEHKVRNFFNNILNPDSPKDVTVDTHQIAAGLFRPLGAGSVEVQQGLSGSNLKGNPAVFSSEGKATSGMGGSYGLYFDATSEGAKLRGVLPREMQSVSWEQLRTLFPDTLKRDKTFIAATEAIWRMVDDKQLDPEGARNLIIAEAEKRGQTEDKLIPSWKTFDGKRRDIGIATTGLMGAAGLATAEEAPAEDEGFATPK